MNLDTQKPHLDTLGHLDLSKFFIIRINEIGPKKGHLDTKTEGYIRGLCSSGLQGT